MSESISIEEAKKLITLDAPDCYGVFARANAVRLKERGRSVNLCGIVNAKSGMCTEDCKFCAQSSHNDASVDCYPLMAADDVILCAESAAANRVDRFSIVTSGLAVTREDELTEIEAAVSRIAAADGIHPCASLGNVSGDVLRRLKSAGLRRYHCNLETARSFYSEICTTRPWDDAVETIRAAKDIGLAVCCGGIVGVGETPIQRVELLAAIQELDVDSVPLNFFNPVKGTRVVTAGQITPLECLTVVAVARLMMPQKEIRIGGGREYNLRDLQSWVLISGADGIMVGNYLTTEGRVVEDDLKMIEDAGFFISKNATEKYSK